MSGEYSSAGYSTELWLSRADELHAEHDLQHRIWEELRWEPLLHHEGITVDVAGTVVTIGGTVQSYADRLMAEAAAKRVRGVREVHSTLTVEPAEDGVRTDTELAEAGTQALVWDVRVPHERISLQAAGGVLTLRGTLELQAQRVAALEAVRNLVGLRDVIDLLHIAPVARRAHLRDLVVNSLKRHPRLRGDRIPVEAHEGGVILHGAVRSLAEREEAEEAARGVPGVSRVDDDLEVLG